MTPTERAALLDELKRLSRTLERIDSRLDVLQTRLEAIERVFDDDEPYPTVEPPRATDRRLH